MSENLKHKIISNALRPYEGTAATGCSKTFDTKMKRKLGSPNYEDLFL